jgi:hypothetical protein
MNRKWIVCCAAVSMLASLFAWAAANAVSTAAPSRLAPFMPSGAALFLEAKDFASLLGEWNSSPIKQQWLKSDDFEAFSRSRVLLRLGEARQQFAAAGGVPPDMRFLSQAAGKESALGFYDIGKLEFLYITRLPSASALQSALWEARTKFESRNAGGTPFFVRTDTESGRVVAFAVSGDYLLLATREDLLASSLELIAGAKVPNITSEDWYTQAVSSAGEAGDLRMILNMKKIVAAPHFRSYWIQSNVKEMGQYSAAVSDLYRSGKDYREERVLSRKPVGSDSAKSESAQQLASPEATQAVADLLRLVPDDAGVYRAAANPGAGESLGLLQSKLLAPQTSSGGAGNLAPRVNLTGGEVGNTSDLETHIDQLPVMPVVAEDSAADLRKAIEAANIQGVLAVESTHVDVDTSFVSIRTGIALAAARDWDAGSTYEALASSIGRSYTTQQLGAGWKNVGKAPDNYMELDGLLPLRAAVRGRILIASNSVETITAILARLNSRTSSAPATFVAGFRHSAERQNFARLSSNLDHSLQPISDPGDVLHQLSDVGGTGMGNSYLSRENQQAPFWTPDPANGAPQFFSGNLASLSRVFSALDSETIVIRDSAGKTFQTVTYHW